MIQKIGNITLECIKADIASQVGFDAVVNAANAQLAPGGGVAGALHKIAGKGLADECKSLAPIKPGEAVISSGHNLPNKYVIHCLGPVYGRDMPSDKLLASCYKNALNLAEENKIKSIAFPAISTGIFGYPMQEAAKIAFSTIIDGASCFKTIEKIRFALFKQDYVDIHDRVLQNLIAKS